MVARPIPAIRASTAARSLPLLRVQAFPERVDLLLQSPGGFFDSTPELFGLPRERFVGEGGQPFGYPIDLGNEGFEFFYFPGVL